MKNNGESIFFHRLFLGCIPLLFLFLGTACEKDSNENNTPSKLIGTWHQTSRTTDDLLLAKDSSRLLIQINDNNICILCDSSAVAVKGNKIIKRSGWDYYGGLFNLAIDLPASWKPVAQDNTLTLERADFKQDGSITKTKLTFVRVPNMEIK
ncbi:MAG: hypothetical protein ACM3P1_09040 [Candidatus Saccharibacteria bacterium]